MAKANKTTTNARGEECYAFYKKFSRKATSTQIKEAIKAGIDKSQYEYISDLRRLLLTKMFGQEAWDYAMRKRERNDRNYGG